ncbi:MAG: hypothetical protein ABW170_23675 [Candidatus Thiodiazotropha sp. L084R]
MNIWALDKATEIKALLLQLRERLIQKSWVLVSEKEFGDRQSVRIHSVNEPSLAAYISLHGQTPGHFVVDLEYPVFEEANRFDNTQIAENLNEEKTLELLVMHLG